MFPIICLLLATLLTPAESAHKCVWIRGALHCRKDPSKHFNVEVRVYDRDGLSFLKVIDPDDLMGVTFTDQDGTFQLDGCGDDFDWIPGIANNPDPYIRITHYCNGPKGEVIELPEFHTFTPNTHEIGIMELDDIKSNSPQQKDILGRFIDRFDGVTSRNGTSGRVLTPVDKWFHRHGASSTESSSTGSEHKLVELPSVGSSEAMDDAPVSITALHGPAGRGSRTKYRLVGESNSQPAKTTKSVSHEDANSKR